MKNLVTASALAVLLGLSTGLEVRAQPSSPQVRAQWKVKLVQAFRTRLPAPVSSETERMSLQSQVEVVNCWAEGLAELSLKSDEFWLAPDDFLRKARAGEKLVNKSSISEDAARNEIVPCIISALIATNPTLDVSDVLVDFESLTKQRGVAVKGYFRSVGDVSYLYEDKRSPVFIIVDTAALRRQDKKRLLQQCARGCPMTILGAVSDSGVKRLEAKFIHWAN